MIQNKDEYFNKRIELNEMSHKIHMRAQCKCNKYKHMYTHMTVTILTCKLHTHIYTRMHLVNDWCCSHVHVQQLSDPCQNTRAITLAHQNESS